MVPMIDIIFLLLIFFFVAARWRPEENLLPFQLPPASPTPQRLGKPEPLMIYIWPTDNGCQVQIENYSTVQLEDENIQQHLATLMDQIRKCLIKQKRLASDPIEIVCHSQVKWDYVAKIYNMFFGAGLTDITFQMTE